MDSHPYIEQLNGYLHCLARLCGPDFRFTASAFPADNDVDEFLAELSQWHKYAILGVETIEFCALQKKMERVIFNGCIAPSLMPSKPAFSYAKKALLEDINEFYGLHSTSLNKDGIFHPLIKGPVYLLDVQSDFFSNALCYVVKIESTYVVTSFILKRSGKKKPTSESPRQTRGDS